MSFAIYEGGKKYSFTEYCLSESVGPRPTAFGTNEAANNKQILKDPDHNSAYSLIKDDNSYLKVDVSLETGEIYVERSLEYTLDPTKYSMERWQTKLALTSTNKALFLALAIIEKMGLRQFRLSAVNPALGRIYELLRDNPFFLRDIGKLGFEFSHITADKSYVYKRN